MKKIILLFCAATTLQFTLAQQIFSDNFSTFNLAKIDGQGGWSTSTPNLGNGSGACFSVGCNVLVVAKTMSYPNFGSCTQAINPLDGVLATGDGPGKSLGAAVNSGSLYVALLVNFTSPASSTSPNGNKQVVRFMDNGFTTASRIYVKQFGVGAFQIGVDKNGSPTNYSSATFAYGVDHLIILKYKFNTASTTDDVAALFVDPDLTLAEPTPTVSVTGTTDATSITRVVFPWNSNTLVTSGYFGIVATAKDWSIASLPTSNISNLQLQKTQATKANFKWNIENTNEVKTFVVQHSSNNINFKTVATINNIGDKNYAQEINLQDGINYVRLLIIDNNGNKKYSAVFTTKAGNIVIKELSLSPNPATNNINITLFSTQHKQINLQVLDMFGRVVLQDKKDIGIGETTINSSIYNLTKGTYLIKIVTTNGEILTSKFIKQ